uniref:Chemokine interleukin-8-like domain-containing protein n=1 Tax=Seriola lalandi dorsalis TaxID=1841481 RepID=A0A3B4YJH0_SERLL
MQLCIKRVTCLAFLTGVLAVVTMASGQMKVNNCCTEVSSVPITAPIIGYRIQRKQLPCVRAVVFETTEGEVCSHWKQDWVFDKVKELEKARRANKTTPAPTTSST